MHHRRQIPLSVCVASAAGLMGASLALIPALRMVKASADIFTDVTASAGIRWKHTSGESRDRLLIEAMGGGVAFVDFDNDGLLDIFLVTGGETPHGKSAAPPRNALYRNLGNGKFEEVAAKAGVDRIPFYGMGVAAADYDNDGFQDLYVTGYPASALFHNNRDGTFTDVTEKAGVKNAGKFAASAAWIDYDRDGRLDLFVANYVKFSFDGPQHCAFEGQPTYCAQTAYEGDAPTLYHNNGDGTFTDVTAQAGLSKLVGRALGVVAIDVDGDGWTDLFVARDASPNLLLLNKHNGVFEDAGLSAEVALNMDGNARAGMGVDAGDLSGNGQPDFVVTNFNDEHHALFVNPGHFPFEERTAESGLAGLTRSYVGWGTQFLDYDNDGNLDLMIVNGHLNEVIERTRHDVSYREPPLLLGNSGGGIFRNMEKLAGPVFREKFRARGLAVGDFDNDGRPDVIFTCLDDTPVLLRNTWEQGGAWIGLELEGTRSNRDAIGAKVTVPLAGKKLVRWITGGVSYLSSHDKRLLFGLGRSAAPREVSAEIHWPSGQVQTVTGLAVGRYHKIVEPR
jgi:enediyne biosynthesis protein E4